MSTTPPTNKFDTNTVQRFRDSRPDEVAEARRFKSDSLTSTKNPYQRMPSRRDLPSSIEGRANFAMDCLVSRDQKGGPPRVAICRSTPQWVSDLVNRSSGPSGMTGQWRQNFVHESLQMIGAKAPPSVATADDLDTLRKWEQAPGKDGYVQAAKRVLTDWDEEEMLKMAQLFERYEVYAQVYEGLMQAGYDGRLYSLPLLRAMHRRETNREG